MIASYLTEAAHVTDAAALRLLWWLIPHAPPGEVTPRIGIGDVVLVAEAIPARKRTMRWTVDRPS